MIDHPEHPYEDPY